MSPWRFAWSTGAQVAFFLLTACGSGGGSSGEAPQQPPRLERFAAVPSVQVAVNPAGVVYALVPQATFVDSGRTLHPATVFSISPQGQPTSLSVSMIDPGGLATDRAGNVYFTETRSCVMHFCDAYATKLAPDGTTTRLLFSDTINGYTTGPGTLSGIAVDAEGNVLVADVTDDVIRKLGSDGVSTLFAGDMLRCTEIDGRGRLAGFCGPSGLTLDAAGNLYVADRYAHTIRRVTPDGDVTTIAGMAFNAGSADGPALSATFNTPAQVAADAEGNLYVADTGNALIRRISASGNVTTLAGTRGAQGFAPGALPGTLDPPTGIALRGRDLYIAMPTAVGRIADVP